MKLNEDAFEFLGIAKFHENGYTGKNITIASKESIIEGVFDDVECDEYFERNSTNKQAKHGTTVMDYIRQVVPDARKIACDFSGITEKNVWKCEGMEKLLNNPPQIGYLTISNALQWRLQYGRIVNLSEKVEGITQIIKYTEDKNK